MKDHEQNAFPCAACTFRTESEEQFIAHTKGEHRADLSLWCKNCAKCFANGTELVAHIKERNCEKEEMIYKCGVKDCSFDTACGQTFASHIKSCHKNEMIRPCIHCAKLFTLPHCLILHMQNECPYKERNRKNAGQMVSQMPVGNKNVDTCSSNKETAAVGASPNARKDQSVPVSSRGTNRANGSDGADKSIDKGVAVPKDSVPQAKSRVVRGRGPGRPPGRGTKRGTHVPQGKSSGGQEGERSEAPRGRRGRGRNAAQQAGSLRRGRSRSANNLEPASDSDDDSSEANDEYSPPRGRKSRGINVPRGKVSRGKRGGRNAPAAQQAGSPRRGRSRGANTSEPARDSGDSSETTDECSPPRGAVYTLSYGVDEDIF